MEIAIFKSDLWHNHVKKKNKSCKKRRSPAGDKKKKNHIQPRSDKKKVLKKVSGTSPKAKGINTNRKSQKKRQHIPRKKEDIKRRKRKPHPLDHRHRLTNMQEEEVRKPQGLSRPPLQSMDLWVSF